VCECVRVRVCLAGIASLLAPCIYKQMMALCSNAASSVLCHRRKPHPHMYTQHATEKRCIHRCLTLDTSKVWLLVLAISLLDCAASCTFICTKHVGVDIRANVSDDVLMSMRQSNSCKRGKDTAVGEEMCGRG